MASSSAMPRAKGGVFLGFGAPEGNGCDHCETGYPIYRVKSAAGDFMLCLDCVLEWFRGRDAAWFESRHAPFRDHIAFRGKEARVREALDPVYQEALARFMAASQAAVAISGFQGNATGGG